MRSLEIKLKAKPFSINKAYYLKSFGGKKATKVRTQECRDWGDQILIQLQSYTEQFESLRKAFKTSKHAISVNIIHYMPDHIMYNKKGEVSAFSQDLTNVEKMLVDLVFDARYNGRMVFDQEIKNLDINDKYIINLVSKKRAASEYLIEIKIRIIDNGIERP